MVTTGYGSPKAVYGLHLSGLEKANINSVSPIESINKETQGIIISSAVGTKKRIEIIKKAKEAGIKILNIKDPDEFLKKIEENIKKKKEEKAKKEKKKKAAEKKKKVAKKEKPELSEKLSEEEKKEAEKKEKDKLLTKQEK